MHIAVVTRSTRTGGAERVIAQLLQSWAKSGVQCSLFCINPYSEDSYSIPETVARYDIPHFSNNGHVNKLRKYAHLRKLIKQVAPDVVLSLPEEIGVYVICALLGTGIPVVVSERNNPWVMPDRKVTRILRRLMYPFVNGLIFQTKQAASFFPDSQQKKGIILPNPLDSSCLPPVYDGVREKTVISAGRLENQKNFPLLIRAFASFYETHSDYRLVIYGVGSKQEELKAMAEDLLPKGSWSMPGKVRDLPERIGRSAVFALSSDYEGVPNVLIEAMAVGTPCVSTNCAPGGAAELIENAKNGLLVPVGDVRALAEGLCYMVDNPADAAQMAQEAVKIRQKLDVEQVAAKWLAYLAGFANKTKG